MKWLRAILTPVTYWRREAKTYEAQARRLASALERAGYEHSEEVMKLQADNAHLMHWNAGLALENSELQFQIAEIRGDA